MPSYRQRRKGSAWEVRWSLPRDPKTGKRRQDSKGGFRTRSDAVDWYERNVAGRQRVTTGRVTCAVWLQQWLAGVDVRDSTRHVYERAIEKHLIPAFGTIILRDLTPDQIRAWQAEYRKRGYAPQSIHSYQRILSTALNQAVSDGLIWDNPAARVPKPRIPRREQPVWSEHDVARVLEVADPDDPHEQLIVTGVLTGLRIGELIGLQWPFVDLGRGTIRVEWQQARNAAMQWTLTPPKSNAGQRTIAIPAWLVERLRDERTRWLEKRLAAGPSWTGTEIVFSHWDGRWLERATVQARLDKLSERLGIPRLSPHGLRHTYSTRLTEMGAHPWIVQRQMGHASPTQTLDYTQIDAGMGRQLASAWDSLLSGGDAAVGPSVDHSSKLREDIGG